MFDLEAAYWTLSTIAQVLVALVAFLGLLGVSRLDDSSRSREEARRLLFQIRDANMTAAQAGFDDDSLISMAALLEGRGRAGFTADQVAFARTQLQQALIGRATMSADLWKLAVSGLGTTAVCLLGLGFLPRIIPIESTDVSSIGALVYFVLVVSGTAWTFFNAGHLVFQALARPVR